MNVLRPNFEKRGGLVTVVTQELGANDQHGKILMVASTDEAGYRETLATGKAVYYSTSRNKRWCKGEESGNFQMVQKIIIDCDGDALIYLVYQSGDGACHTGAYSCFYRGVKAEEPQLMYAPKAGEKEKLESIDLPVDPDLARRLTTLRPD